MTQLLRTRPPVAEQFDEVGGAVGVAPRTEQQDQVAGADSTGVIEIPRARSGAARSIKEVGRAVSEGPYEGNFLSGAAVDCNGEAKPVARRAINGKELEKLLACVDVEQIRRAGFAAVVVVLVGSDDGGGATDCDGFAEEVESRAVVGK